MFFKRTFPGGAHPLRREHHGKGFSDQQAIQVLPAPEQVILPLSQHVGAPCAPAVHKGDLVKMGQVVGQMRGYVAAPIHASVSGEVVAVEERLHPNGQRVMSVVIQNDFQDTPAGELTPIEPWRESDPETLLARIKEAGIVGLGGAAFPTHVKLSPPEGKTCDVVIVNGAECEPFLTADHRVMVERSRAVVQGLQIAKYILGARSGYIGVEDNKPDAMLALGQAAGSDLSLEVVTLPVKYPQGSEKQLIYALTRRKVPAGGLPIDAGVVVINASTAAAIADAVTRGLPLVSRVVTVTGYEVKAPANFLVRLGTPVSTLIQEVGGLPAATGKVIAGGPMMGQALFDLDVPVIKGTSGILMLPEAKTQPKKPTNCIRCGRCVSVCPMHLLPLSISAHSLAGNVGETEKLGVLNCLECGCCDYSCPASRPLLESLRVAKRAVIAARRNKEGGK